jgi:hypothetical protein
LAFRREEARRDRDETRRALRRRLLYALLHRATALARLDGAAGEAGPGPGAGAAAGRATTVSASLAVYGPLVATTVYEAGAVVDGRPNGRLKNPRLSAITVKGATPGILGSTVTGVFGWNPLPVTVTVSPG